jgi:hypothetical protein
LDPDHRDVQKLIARLSKVTEPEEDGPAPHAGPGPTPDGPPAGSRTRKVGYL